MLEKLQELKRKKVEVHLANGEKMRCIPQQYLQEEYDSYLVCACERYGGFLEGMLVEFREEEIKEVIPL
ncbi:hypothetical protein [Bacillus xiapuensis]|uniref:hypothetical protein n=1 Tax=Bacillus xiapuensis TaxID=2014075 RepID=UPI000C24D310|nr:hypothetical protein [Bacillus xiapuensis]